MKKTFTKFPGKKILIVEDYFVNQEVIRDLLQLMEVESDLAENGKEAVENFSKKPYDAILMDVQMPVMDGFQATKDIRKLEGSKRHLIIALTANALTGDREKCLEAGMDDYLTKPIEAEKLEKILIKYFG